MEMEGILIHKAIHKERDLIGTLLLREGSLLNLYFYGGRGGGKSQKGSILELGFMLKVKLSSRIKKDQDIQIASEWNLIWNSEAIRSNHKAFYLSTFYFEFIKKIAQPKDLGFDDHENAGLFKVLSNALFYMDKDLLADKFHFESHMAAFLSKMIFELGISPDIKHCSFCQADLNKVKSIFNVEQGGFACINCTDNYHQEELVASERVLKSLQYFPMQTYKEIKPMEFLDKAQVHSLFNYICFHFGWDKSSFISYSML